MLLKLDLNNGNTIWAEDVVSGYMPLYSYFALNEDGVSAGQDMADPSAFNIIYFDLPNTCGYCF